MPKIDDSIRKALAEAAEYYGSILAIAQKAGVSHSTLSKYQSGQIKTINQTTWNALEPHLRPFLPGNMPIIHAPRNSGNVVGINHGTIGPDCLSAVMNKILSAEELSDEEKVKIMKVLQK